MALEKVKAVSMGLTARLKDWFSDLRADVQSGGGWFKSVLAVVGVYLLVSLALALYWGREPDMFDVYQAALSQMTVTTPDNSDLQGERHPKTGAVTTSTLIAVVDVMLHKPGGFLSNDISLPGVMMDNIPNWEYGVLIQVRDLSKAMREAFSRSQSQSVEIPELAFTEPRFNFSHDRWIWPSSESNYEEGIGYLKDYLQKINDSEQHDIQFYARADNLRYWLNTVETRLGSLSQRLSASVGQRRINVDLAKEEKAVQTTSAPGELEVKTPWLEIDDVFYEARGASWALIHFLRAVEVDFADVLEKKNAVVSLRQIIRELEATQETVYSPMILNGSGFGLLANHSLVMASYISRANAAIIDLRDLLAQG